MSTLAGTPPVGSTTQWLGPIAGGLRRLFGRDILAIGSILVLALLVVLSVLAPVIAPHDPLAISADNLVPPSPAHPFGTDEFGRDILSRVLWGGRVTLLSAAVGVGISTCIGVPLGLLAGYSSRWISSVIMRAMDVMLAFPGLLLALIIVTIIGPGAVNVMVAIGISFIPVFARVVFASTLAAKVHDYVVAARVVGCSPFRITVWHILPNVLTQIIVIASSAIGWAILQAATLNFLGFGVRLPTPEWGADLSSGRNWLGVAWWLATFPGVAITIAILASNYLGDAIAQILEPHSRGREEALQLTVSTVAPTVAPTISSGGGS
jgi:ABC-type dipeptide/oligopeptide/nickel transport system permease subunit